MFLIIGHHVQDVTTFRMLRRVCRSAKRACDVLRAQKEYDFASLYVCFDTEKWFILAPPVSYDEAIAESHRHRERRYLECRNFDSNEFLQSCVFRMPRNELLALRPSLRCDQPKLLCEYAFSDRISN